MKVEKAIFAAGCFWGVQHQFERIPGVLNTTVGYTGGPEANPAYTQVKAHMTHHVEAIFVDYDGPQYRSMIFYMDEKQKSEAEEVIELLRSKGHRVNTRLRPAEKFWEAEGYHQHYYDKMGGEPYCHIRVKKF